VVGGAAQLYVMNTRFPPRNNETLVLNNELNCLFRSLRPTRLFQ
jgi:hypothetical protein